MIRNSVAFGAARIVLAGLFLCGVSATAFSAEVLPELPFTARHGVGARAAGMGFAHMAVAEDGSALLYNPAGLAQIKRIEMSGGLLHEAQDRTVGFNTASGGFPGTGIQEETTDTGSTQFGHLSLAYPFPTYRGSLVMGLAFQRVASLKSDYFRDGILRAPQGDVTGLYETESFTETGGVNLWTAGVAGDVSPNLSLGASVSFIQGSTHQDFQVGRYFGETTAGEPVVEATDEFLYGEVREADLTGVTGSVGALARMSEYARLGVIIDFPQRYEYEGTLSWRLEDQEKIDRETYDFTDTITLPFSFGAGVALTPPGFLIAADARLTDWAQIDFEGPVRSKDREDAYRSTVDLNIGAEYQLPFHPTRIRAGWARQPLPYKLVPSTLYFTFVPDDGNANTSDDASYWLRDYDEASVKTERNFFTLGAGTLVDNTVTLDVAWVHGLFERSGGPITEKWTTNRIFGTVTYRF